jgi:hypothetical protein
MSSIKEMMIAAIKKKLPAGYIRGEMDSIWVIIIEKNGKVKLGGYAEDELAGNVKKLEDLPFIELAYLHESKKEDLENAREELKECQ